MSVRMPTFRRFLNGDPPTELNEADETVERLAHALRYFDWTYEYSDDGRVWRRARELLDKLHDQVKALSPEEKRELANHPLIHELRSNWKPGYDAIVSWTSTRAPKPTDTQDQLRKEEAFKQFQRLATETGVQVRDVLHTAKHGDMIVLTIHRPTAYTNIPYYKVAPIEGNKPDLDSAIDVDVYTIRTWKKQHEAKRAT